MERTVGFSSGSHNCATTTTHSMANHRESFTLLTANDQVLTVYRMSTCALEAACHNDGSVNRASAVGA